VLAEVVIGSLVLFGIARLALPRLVLQRGWLWVALSRTKFSRGREKTAQGILRPFEAESLNTEQG
jgi:hypothetical protein